MAVSYSKRAVQTQSDCYNLFFYVDMKTWESGDVCD